MKEFRPYLKLLTNLTLPQKREVTDVKSRIESALNGQANSFLRKNVGIETLRNSGIFFTGHKLANDLAKPFVKSISAGISVFDPACGAGDLLLAAARSLPVADSLLATLSLWGTKLHGFDIDPEFVKATKIRLLLLAQSRLKISPSYSYSIDKIFPNIKPANFLTQSLSDKSYGLVLMNPPYHRVQIDNSWAKGLTTVAAQFVSKCVIDLPKGTKIGAILPDVLRTGTRYAKWRTEIEAVAAPGEIKIIGKFDAATDVDVFQLELLIGPTTKAKKNWYPIRKVTTNLSDYFQVKTGTVVPFRDKERGVKYPYIDASVVPAWGTVSPGSKTRCFDKTVFTPPFVVIRRTSGPSDKIRAVGSIIIGKKDVAVENHLIVLKPISGGLTACRTALTTLAATTTTKWLNKRIRCRHLTIDAVKKIPYSGN
ncbi:MAG: N-6 DNA methylase [Elusimicrobiales bacterium]|nr:N-6 DNA methylase [Elusimicrobiales bacterium]